MGSSTVSENCSESSPNCPALRPEFFPCNECNRWFTKLALEVHKKSCSETIDCVCSICIKYNHKPKVCISRHLLTETKKLYIQNQLLQSELNSPESSSRNCSFSGHESDTNHDMDETKLADPLDTEINNPSSELHNSELCERKLFCPVCTKHLNQAKYGRHIFKHCLPVNADRQIPCPKCNQNFPAPEFLLLHFYGHVSEHPSDCPECSCYDDSCATFDDRLDPSKERFVCYICRIIPTDLNTLVDHMKVHATKGVLHCKPCSSYFYSSIDFQQHIRSHLNTRPFPCTMCDMTFADPHNLKIHRRVHTKETPYKCTFCSREFSQQGNLRRHMALHVKRGEIGPHNSLGLPSSDNANAEPLPMEIEKFDHSSNSSLSETEQNVDQSAATENPIAETPQPEGSPVKKKRGRKKKKPIMLHTCTLCGKIFTWKHDLEVHYRVHTGEKPYQCELCGKGFAQNGAVRVHKIRNHSNKSLPNNFSYDRQNFYYGPSISA